MRPSASDLRRTHSTPACPERSLVALALFLAACSGGGPKPPASPTVSNGPWSVSADGGSVVLSSADAGTLLSFDTDGFQLGTVKALDATKSYDPYWLVVNDGFFTPVVPDGLRFRKATSTAVTQTSATQLDLALTFEGNLTGTLTLTADAEGRFGGKLVPGTLPSGTAIAFMRLRVHTDASEGLYGLGETPDQLNHRGTIRPMQLEPFLAVESTDTENHVPVPLLIGTRGWGIFVQSKRFGVFDVAKSDPSTVEITYGTAEQSSEGLTFHLFAAAHPLDITRRYYDVTGDPLLPAPWALGPWLWRNDTSGEAQALDDFMQVRSRDLATSAMWLDRPYATWVNSFDFDPSKYTDPAAMISTAHAAGLRMAVWHSPYLEAMDAPLVGEAADAGYFPPNPGLLLNQWGPPIDFTNPAAYGFWSGLLDRYVDAGIEGYKLDYGEDVAGGLSGAGTGWQFSDGSTERTMQHDFTLLYHRVYADKHPGFLLCRAGKWGDQTHVSVVWPGDIDARLTKWLDVFDDGTGKMITGVGGLHTAVLFGVGLGPSGFPFFGADTGGYRHAPANKETWVRWVEQSALSTVMQTGDASSQLPWEYTTANGRDDAALAIYQQYARLHLRLFPYEWSLAKKLAADGRALMRPVGLAYPELGQHPDDEYLFGDDLFVAPVITAGATSRDVVFPPGDWLSWWDGSVHHGMETVQAPLEVLPLYLRKGGAVALLRPTIDTLAPATDTGVDSFANDAGILWVRAAPDAQTTLYDGTQITVSSTSVSVAPGTTFTQGAVVEVLGLGKKPSSVSSTMRASKDEVASSADGWFWDGTSLWLRMPGGQSVTVTP
jgi:alpha-D-xyloside xylohydrolase